MTTTKVYGACPHDCPDTCSVISEVKDGRVVRFYADPEHPVTHGWLCAKVRPYLDHVYHPDRLRYPLRRIGPKGSGQWRRISWDEALAEIGARWRAIIEQFGAEAILPYSYSGTLGLVQMLVSSARFWNRLGASQLQRSICGAAAEFAITTTLGVRRSPNYEDVSHSQVVIVWGHNPVSTAPHFMPHLKKAQRRGCKLVVIDPRRTRTARGADWHLAPKPATDGALALGLARIIVDEGWADEAWLARHSVGWRRLRRRLSDYPLEKVSLIVGLPEADIVKLARLYATNRPSKIKIADGLQRHRNGGQTVRAISTLPAITGQYGMGGGGLAYSTSDTVQWANATLNRWQGCPPPGRWVNMNRLGAALLGEIDDPPIKSLFVFGANPVAVNPNASRVVQGMQRQDLFTVVHELFMTDTAEFADIVLPSTSQLEQKDLHKAYGHTVLNYNRQAIPPLGESISNWELMGRLAREMGFQEPWLYQSPDEVIDELLRASTVCNPALGDVTLEQLKSRGSLPLRLESDVPFSDGRFPTPSGKVELYAQSLADQGIDPLPAWIPSDDIGADKGEFRDGTLPPGQSLNLISGAAHHFVSSTLANQPGLLQREGEPFLEIHPQDAAARDISDGDMVIVENGRGWCDLRAVVTEGIRVGVIASPKGRWSKLGNGRNVNWTTSDALADMAGQSTFHTNRVWVRRKSMS
jgi:anaerobic selenocysteine-containing dehydrogenase